MAKDNQKGVLESLRSLLSPGDDDSMTATQMLRDDHQRVEAMFQEFESADRRRKADIAKRTIAELTAHATLEEELFYPAVAREMDDEEPVECAIEEHGLAKKLLAELESMRPGAEHFEAKYKVLAEIVRHHVREEESTILPAAESSDIDLRALGERMRERKQELVSRGAARRRAAGARSAVGRKARAGSERKETSASRSRRSTERGRASRGRSTGGAARKSGGRGGRKASRTSREKAPRES